MAAAADIREGLAALSALPVTHNSIANTTARKATSSHALNELLYKCRLRTDHSQDLYKHTVWSTSIQV